MENREVPKTEYLKIRNYIVDMIYHANGESVLIPSSRELAKQFHVAHITARKALDLLKKENLIYTKKGVGTFSKAIKSISAVPFKTVGIIIDRGKNIFNDYSGYFAPALTGLRLTKRNCVIRQISLFGIDSIERIEEEIRNLYIDALFWIRPPEALNPLLEKLAAEGMPVVALFSSAKVRRYDIDFTQTSREIGTLFEKENRSLCYYIDNLFREEFFFSGMKEVYQKAGKALQTVQFQSIELLADALDKTVPDFIQIACDYDTPILDLLDRKKIDIREKCRLVTYTPEILDPRFSGIQILPPEEEISNRIADDLLAMMKGTKLSPEMILIPTFIKRVGMKNE